MQGLKFLKKMRIAASGLAIGTLAVWLLPVWLTGAVAASLEMKATDPSHIPQGLNRNHRIPRDEPRPEVRGPVNPLPTSNVLFQEPDDSLRDYPIDQTLSNQCRARRFLQVRDHMFIVKLGKQTYGAAVGGHWGLFDPQGLSREGSIYVIRNQDTGRCQVHLIGPG